MTRNSEAGMKFIENERKQSNDFHVHKFVFCKSKDVTSRTFSVTSHYDTPYEVVQIH